MLRQILSSRTPQLPQTLLPACSRALSSASQDLQAVCFVDPRVLLDEDTARDAASWTGSEQALVTAQLPASLVQALPQAHFELGDSDDPESAWRAGKRKELFEYRLVGIHRVVSGHTCAVAAPAGGAATSLQGLRSALHAGAGAGVSWKSFEQLQRRGGDAWWRGVHENILFAGELADCASAAVYVAKDASSVMVSSNYDEM